MKITEMKIIFLIALIGTIIVVFTAQPDPINFVDEKKVEVNYDLFFTYNIIKYPASAQVSRASANDNITLGINLQTDSINFGIVPGDGSVKKEVNLTSKDDKASKVMIKAYGNIKPLLNFDQNDFILNDRKSIAVTLNTGGQAEGNYTGEIDVIIQRSKYGILNFILGY